MKKGGFVFLLLFVSNVYSQKYKFDCITIEKNKNTLQHILSDTLYKRSVKNISIFRVNKKENNKEEPNGSSFYSTGRGNINVQIQLEPGDYLIKIKIIHEDKRIYEIEKVMSF